VFSVGSMRPLPNPGGVFTKVVNAFMYPPVVLRQSLLGNRVDWISNATRAEVIAKLADPRYQNVVFIGHGAQGLFRAADGPVTSLDILEAGIPRKRGELIQHTCGSRCVLPFQDVLLEDPSRSFTFHRDVSELENYRSAWALLLKTAFLRLKAR